MPAYQFYDSSDTGVRPEDLPEIGAEVTGLHFGSYCLAAAPVADAAAALAQANRRRFISVDPNVRPTVVPDAGDLARAARCAVPLADLVKISAEDLELLWPGRSAASFAEDVLRRGARLVVVTDGGRAAHGWTASGHHASATPPKVTVIDTVGAGDTFQAALIACSCKAHPDGPGAGLDALDLAGSRRCSAMLRGLPPSPVPAMAPICRAAELSMS